MPCTGHKHAERSISVTAKLAALQVSALHMEGDASKRRERGVSLVYKTKNSAKILRKRAVALGRCVLRRCRGVYAENLDIFKFY